MRKPKTVKHVTLEDLEFCDGVYNVGHLVEIDHPWVSKEVAEEVLEVVNSHIDWVLDELSEAKDE